MGRSVGARTVSILKGVADKDDTATDSIPEELLTHTGDAGTSNTLHPPSSSLVWMCVCVCCVCVCVCVCVVVGCVGM